MTMPSRRTRSQIAAAALLLFLSKNLFATPDPSPPPDSLGAAPSRFATFDGAKVHYKSLGDPTAKTAVIFIHGWSCDMTTWPAQVPAFAGKAPLARHRLVNALFAQELQHDIHALALTTMTPEEWSAATK